MRIAKFISLLAPLTLCQTLLAAPFSFPLPQISLPKIRSLDVGVTWSASNTPTYRFTALGFTEAQSQRIQSALVYVYYALSLSGSSNTGPLSTLQQCATDHTTRYEAPNWMAEDQEVRRYMSGVVSAFMVLGGAGGSIVAFSEESPQEGSEFIRAGYAPLKTIKAGSKVDLHLNTSFVENSSIADLAATLYHEMLHNAGWSHPNTGKRSDYPGTFIAETDECVRSEILRIAPHTGAVTVSKSLSHPFLPQ